MSTDKEEIIRLKQQITALNFSLDERVKDIAQLKSITLGQKTFITELESESLEIIEDNRKLLERELSNNRIVVQWDAKIEKQAKKIKKLHKVILKLLKID